MPKKIYDIKPPKVARKVEETIRELGGAASVKKTRRVSSKSSPAIENVSQKPKTSTKQEKRFPLRELIIGGGVVALLLGVYVVFKLPKAEVSIWPALDTMESQEKVTASVAAKSVDVAKKTIPARLVEVQKEASQEFAATGSASNDGKASGTIRVYNKVSPVTPLTLKAGTHFLSDGGKYFVTLDKIVVPAMQGKTAGSVSVRVQAEDSGEEYNIGSSKFSVPKLSGTTYYYGIWGESTAPMVGGKTGTVKKVTEDDIENAKDVVTKKLLADAKESLKSGLSQDEVFLDEAITSNVAEATSSVKAGTVVEKFSESAKINVSVLVFKKQDLEELMKVIIADGLPEGKTYLADKLGITYASDTVDMKAKTETLEVKVSAKTYTSIDTVGLIDAVSHKSSDEIRQVVIDKYTVDVSKVEVDFWPFWVKTSPKNQNRIMVNLKFE